jgi:excisionase family DNA binding protein
VTELVDKLVRGYEAPVLDTRHRLCDVGDRLRKGSSPEYLEGRRISHESPGFEELPQNAVRGELGSDGVADCRCHVRHDHFPKAVYLGIRVETVRSWIRSGRLRASRLAGQRVLRIRASDLEAVLEPVEPLETSERE